MSKEGESCHLKGSEGRGWRGRLCFNIHHSSKLPAEGQGLPGTHQWLDIAYPGNNLHFHISYHLQYQGFLLRSALQPTRTKGC